MNIQPKTGVQDQNPRNNLNQINLTNNQFIYSLVLDGNNLLFIDVTSLQNLETFYYDESVICVRVTQEQIDEGKIYQWRATGPGYVTYGNYSLYCSDSDFDGDGVENNDDLCPAVQLYNESESAAAATHQYEEIILQYGSVPSDDPPLIYVALIEPDGLGLDGRQIDFEIIVPDDGHMNDTVVTPYYFYVELEAGDYS